MLGTQHGRTCNGRGWLPIAPDAQVMKIFMISPFVVLTNDRRDAPPTANGSPALSMEVRVDGAPFVTSWRIPFRPFPDLRFLTLEFIGSNDGTSAAEGGPIFRQLGQW